MTISKATKRTRLDILIKAIDWLLAHPKRQTVGALARIDYKRASPLDPRAECFCLIGRAIYEAHEAGEIKGLATAGGETMYRRMDTFLKPINLSTMILYGANDVDSPHLRQARLEAFRQRMVVRREEFA